MENKIALETVVKYFNETVTPDGYSYDWDLFQNEDAVDMENHKIALSDNEVFEFKLDLGYEDSRRFVEALLDLVASDEDDYIEYAMKESYEIMMVLAACTNIDPEGIADDMDKVVKLSHNKGVKKIISFLKYQDEYDYIDALLREFELRLSQAQARLNNRRKIDGVVDSVALMLQEVAERYTMDDVNNIMEVVTKLKNVEQKDIINKVLELQKQKEESK